jgi:hypothetical protein
LGDGDLQHISLSYFRIETQLPAEIGNAEGSDLLQNGDGPMFALRRLFFGS